MEVKEVLSLALYALAMGSGALVIILNALGGFDGIITIFLGIAVFCLGLAGISLLGGKKK